MATPNNDRFAEELGKLQDELAAQRQAIEHLERAVASLAGADDAGAARRPGKVPPSERGTGDPPGRPPAADRRSFVWQAATAAVAGGVLAVLGDSGPAAAAPGSFDGNPAVNAVASPSSGIAVTGTTASGQAVLGVATTNGVGVKGESSTGTGTQGWSQSATGVLASTNGGTALVANSGFGGVHLRLDGGLPEPPTAGFTRQVGSIIRDLNGALWFCIASGNPGVWRKISGPETAGVLHILPTPKRVYDSRPGFPPATGTKAPLAAGSPRAVDLTANSSGIPSSAIAVLVGLTVTGTTGTNGGFLAVYRSGISWPGTSNLNWSAPNQNVAVTTVTAVDNGMCALYANQSTHVVVDVLGYYR